MSDSGGPTLRGWGEGLSHRMGPLLCCFPRNGHRASTWNARGALLHTEDRAASRGAGGGQGLRMWFRRWCLLTWKSPGTCPLSAQAGPSSWSLQGWPPWSITSESPFPAPAVRGSRGSESGRGERPGGRGAARWRWWWVLAGRGQTGRAVAAAPVAGPGGRLAELVPVRAEVAA